MPGRRATAPSTEYLSTEQLSWLLGVSPAAVRRMIKAGDIAGVRLPGGFRVHRDEALKRSRERIERETGHTITDRELTRLVDETLARNEARTDG
jgi:excisionase family DNA binding protein